MTNVGLQSSFRDRGRCVRFGPVAGAQQPLQPGSAAAADGDYGAVAQDERARQQFPDAAQLHDGSAVDAQESVAFVRGNSKDSGCRVLFSRTSQGAYFPARAFR